MKKLGVAVIGTGFWGVNHARAYKEMDNTNLLAICDVNSDRAKIVANQYGVKAYTDSAQMLKDPEIEAVSVCTWATILAKEAKRVLDSGKHVLVEKPMANSAELAKTLVQTAQKQGLHLTVGFLMRFLPGLQNIKQAIEQEQLGKVVCATTKRVSQWPVRIGDAGVLKDTTIHDIDVMNYLTGEQPVSVYARIGSIRRSEFEDYVHIMLTYKDGKSAFIESNWLTPYKIRNLIVTGTEAIMRLDYLTQELWIENGQESRQPRFPIEEPLKLELQHFAKCITEKIQPLVTGIDGVKALELSEAAIKSSEKNKLIELK